MLKFARGSWFWYYFFGVCWESCTSMATIGGQNQQAENIISMLMIFLCVTVNFLRQFILWNYKKNFAKNITNLCMLVSQQYIPMFQTHVCKNKQPMIKSSLQIINKIVIIHCMSQQPRQRFRNKGRGFNVRTQQPRVQQIVFYCYCLHWR